MPRPTSLAFHRLQSLRLLPPPSGTVREMVRTLIAVQAQDFAGTKWALGLRTGADETEVDRTFNDGEILRTHLLRPTWHMVVPEDIRWLVNLSSAKILRSSAPLFKRFELDTRTLNKAAKVMGAALAGRQLSRESLREILEKSGISTRGDLRYSYLLVFAEMECVVCSGGREGKQFSYALLDDRAPQSRTMSREDSIAELTLRYFTTRGPATVQDFAKWSWLTLTECRQGMSAVAHQLTQHDVDGIAAWSGPASAPTAPDKPLAQFVSIYDEYIASYKDPRALHKPEHATALKSMGNALTGVLLIDGIIAGTFRRREKAKHLQLHVSLLRKVSRVERSAIQHNAELCAAFFGRLLDLEVTHPEM
ncbi:MAG: winged helix DNA-binding domain-containing protein [Gemmatimonas sp.]